jgi:S-phase kinase-associated protein 1
MSDKITLVTKDSIEHICEKRIYKHSKYLNDLFDSSSQIDSDEDIKINLENIDNQTLTEIIKFLDYYHDKPFEKIPKPLRSDDLSVCVEDWYVEYLNNMGMEILFEVIKSANFLEIESLLDLTCAKVATMLKGKSVEEIRETFGIENDFTPEEEEEIKKENTWCDNI